VAANISSLRKDLAGTNTLAYLPAALGTNEKFSNIDPRPEYSMIHRVSEGTESMVFKSKFVGEI
jgi:hypothetical protein